MTPNRLVVIGASAGGVEALGRLASQLEAGFPAPICIAVHFPPSGTSVLPRILERHGPLWASHARDAMPLEPGHIYIAPPDRHLLIDWPFMRVDAGPKENGCRPAVDPLFRSAARTLGPSVIGVVLSGNLDDGTEGLRLIKRFGGIAIVQDPHDALYPSMPQSACDHVDVDYVVPLEQLGRLLTRLASEPAPALEPSLELAMDDDDGGRTVDALATSTVGTASGFICPECGGALWQIPDDEGPPRFRCRVGHRYSADAMLSAQSAKLEEAIWIAVRTLEESAALANSVADRSSARGNARVATRFRHQAERARRRADMIREMLLEGEDPVSDDIPRPLENAAASASLGAPDRVD